MYKMFRSKGCLVASIVIALLVVIWNTLILWIAMNGGP